MALLLALVPAAESTVLPLSVQTQSRSNVTTQADLLVKNFSHRISMLTQWDRDALSLTSRYHEQIQFSMPVVVKNVNAPPIRHTQSALTLNFDSTGTEAFTSSYQALLQSVYNTAQPLLNTYFGQPQVGGAVHVANFDATIGDRNAIAGGYYVTDNGSGVPEIRFPVYNSNEAAAVNFVHCLLLAYLGPDGYNYDAYEEGLVRAVVMRVCRTSGALPSTLDSDVIESTLENTYDIGGYYDWYNQRALGAPQFIAANLLNSPLPASGGSGLYLTRYKMAGSAWGKVLVQYPTFAAQLNNALLVNPAIGTTPSVLISTGQSIINSLAGTTATVEGRSFSDWYRHQFILDTTIKQQSQTYLSPIPITTGLAGADFGVFIVQATYFKTDSSGNETLLSGTSYPIFWDDTFNRINTNVQDEVIDIVASEGTVTPNFPDLYGGQPYRCTIDLPVSDQIQRVYLPAGGIATATNTTPNDFYGTLSGVANLSGDTVVIQVSIGGTVIATVPVTNDAFGTVIGTAQNYNQNASVTLSVLRTRGGTTTTLYSRVVNKQIGDLGVDLQVPGDGTDTVTNGLSKGIQFIGFPIDPFTSDPTSIFGVSANNLLLARYDSSASAYNLYPSIEPVQVGHGYFVRLDSAQPAFSVDGRLVPNVSGSVSLKPGWNMVSTPIAQAIATSQVRLLHAADFPTTFAEGLGTTIGLDFFKFLPGNPDPVTGAPEGGTFTAATEFDPNVGYYVLCLAPEGITLTFDPATSSLLSRKSLSSPAVTTTSGWQLKVQGLAGNRESDVILGETAGAPTRFTTAYDTPLPPAISGGLQLASSNGSLLYRDMRPLNSVQNYTLQMSGLTIGQSVTLHFSMAAGLIRTFKLVDLDTGKTQTLLPNTQASFTATKTIKHFMVQVTGK